MDGCNKMKKYIILSNASNYGGGEKSIEILIESLAKKNLVIIFVENNIHEQALKKIKGNIKVYSFMKGKGVFTTIYNLFLISKYIKEKNNIVISNTNKGAFYLAVLSFFIKFNDRKNILIYIRDYQWKYVRFIFNRLKKAKYIIPTKSLLESPKYTEGINKNNIYVIDNATVVEHNISYKDGKYVLCLANISRWKGLNFLIEAYVSSNLYLNNVKLLICGKVQDEKFNEELYGLINKYNMERYIDIKSFQMDKEKLYLEALFVVNSSIGEFGGPETFGRTIIEAWSYKKAVISFNVGGPKYIIDNNINGFLVEEKNIEEMAKKMRYLYDYKDICQKMGEEGYLKVKSKYNVETMKNKILSCIEK